MNGLLQTDASLRSRLDYGTPDFPFACYLDRFEEGKKHTSWHWHTEFEFSIVQTGSITCYAGPDCIRLSAGDAFFLNSGTIHRFEAEQGVMVNFIFSPEFIAEKRTVVYQKYIHPLLQADYKYHILQKNFGNEPILDRLQRICDVMETECFGKELQIRNQIALLWNQFAELTFSELDAEECSVNRISQERLQRMLEFIHHNFRERISLADISEAANISKSEALRCFKAGIKTTPVAYLKDYRLSQAYERLMTTADSVTEISQDSGFEETGYFCQIFKKHYGMTPGACRKVRKK